MLELKKKVDVTFTVIGLIIGLLAIVLTDYNFLITGFFGGFITSSFILHKDFKHAVKSVSDPKADVTLKKVYSNLLVNLAIYAIVLILFGIFIPKYAFATCAFIAIIYRTILINLVGRLKG